MYLIVVGEVTSLVQFICNEQLFKHFRRSKSLLPQGELAPSKWLSMGGNAHSMQTLRYEHLRCVLWACWFSSCDFWVRRSCVFPARTHLFWSGQSFQTEGKVQNFGLYSNPRSICQLRHGHASFYWIASQDSCLRSENEGLCHISCFFAICVQVHPVQINFFVACCATIKFQQVIEVTFQAC